eukprot:11049610-Karenia_brevis.AAC.1
MKRRGNASSASSVASSNKTRKKDEETLSDISHDSEMLAYQSGDDSGFVMASEFEQRMVAQQQELFSKLDDHNQNTKTAIQASTNL